LPFIAVFILYIVAIRRKETGSKKAIFDLFLLSLVVFLIVTIGSFNLLKLIYSPEGRLIIFAILIGILVILFSLYAAIFQKQEIEN
jgi:hypothetical protein